MQPVLFWHLFPLHDATISSDVPFWHVSLKLSKSHLINCDGKRFRFSYKVSLFSVTYFSSLRHTLNVILLRCLKMDLKVDSLCLQYYRIRVLSVLSLNPFNIVVVWVTLNMFYDIKFFDYYNRRFSKYGKF